MVVSLIMVSCIVMKAPISQGKGCQGRQDAIKRRVNRVLQEQVLFDHLGGLNQDLGRDRQAEYLRRLQVDDYVELPRLFDGEILRLGALQDLVHVSGSTAK